MLPFLNIPIILPGNKGEGEKEVMARVQPEQIQCYYPGYHFGTFIYMIGNVVLLSNRDVKEIEANLDMYWKEVGKMEKGKSILSLQ